MDTATLMVTAHILTNGLMRNVKYTVTSTITTQTKESKISLLKNLRDESEEL